VQPDDFVSISRGGGQWKRRSVTTQIAHIAGVDFDRLKKWMDDSGLGEGPIEFATEIGGGTQNIIVAFRRGPHKYVLRRPPVQFRAHSSETILKEVRVLRVLEDSDVPCARLIADCDDSAVLGAPFYLMEHLDGFNPFMGLPANYIADPTMQQAMGLAMAEGVAALANVDHVALGLDSLGHADGWLERQVDRWRSQLASYEDFKGYSCSLLPQSDEAAQWLESNKPDAWQPGLIHGDYHFANVLFDRDAPTLLGIIDWELATIGDPLLDLAHLLASWSLTRRAMKATALPPRSAVVSRYVQRTSRDLTHFAWFRVLACYRFAVLLEGTHARACAGLAKPEVGELLHQSAIGLLKQALRIRDGKESDE
jgi:aminoglycoside phosphotransferase (APT) family kinase protein